ncbi:MAG: small multi-drug export protein [Candidatus Pacebacteria bacterium]|nr:small multi-drug export protein [Candidatus Paceibacterota bacterium]
MNELWTIIIAASPIVELRGAIPVAMGIFNFPWPKALILSYLGNILPIIPLIWFLNKLSDYLSKQFAFFANFFGWLFKRTRQKTADSFNRWGKWALIFFVAIPLPFTGVWTGSVAAFLFGIENRQAFWLISLGAALAGIIVTILTLLGINILT